MNMFKNQSGAALIIVLITIAVIGVITPPIINNIMNNAMQFNEVENELQLDKLQEMGDLYVNKVVEIGNERVMDYLYNMIEDLGETDRIALQSLYIANLQQELARLNLQIGSEYEVILNNEHHRFKIELLNMNAVNENSIQIEYAVTPSINEEYDESNRTINDLQVKLIFDENE